MSAPIEDEVFRALREIARTRGRAQRQARLRFERLCELRDFLVDGSLRLRTGERAAAVCRKGPPTVDAPTEATGDRSGKPE